MLTEFTSYEEIRAVLGVSPEELEDVTLSMPLYEQLLKLEIESVGVGIVAAFQTVSVLSPPARTAPQQLLYDVARLYSAYAIANHLLTSLPYFGELRIQDERAQKERVSDPYEKTKIGVQAWLANLRLRLSAAFVAVVGGTAVSRTVRTLTVATGIALDPVTNT